MSAVRAHVTVELCHGLHAMADLPKLYRGLRGAAREELERLGLPAVPSVSVVCGDDARAIRVRLNGTLVTYSPELLVRVWQSVAGRDSQPSGLAAQAGGFPDAWLQEALEALDEQDRASAVVELASSLAVALMRRRPEMLLGDKAVDLYVRELQALVPEAAEREIRWGAILRPLLGLTGTLADHASVGHAVLAAVELELTDEDVVESAFAALRGLSLEVRWDSGLPDWSADAGAALGTELFDRLGLPLPDVRLLHGETADGARMAIRTLGVPAVPATMIGRDEVLVEARMERDALERSGATAMMHPVTGKPAAVVPADAGDDVVRPGSAVDAKRLAIRLLARELQEQRGRLVSTNEVEHQLALLRAKVPAVVAAAVAMFPLAELTRIVRLLVEDGISMGNLKGFLDALLEYETSRPQRPPVLKEPPAAKSNGGGRKEPSAHDYADMVRESLGRPLPAAGELPVIAVDPELETRLATVSRTDELLAQGIRDAAWSVCGEIAGDAKPVVVTSVGARRALRAVLVDELPSLDVVSERELPPDLERRLVGTIAVGAV